MKESENKIKPDNFSFDDFFTTQEQRDDAKKEKIEEINISDLDTFPNHPFQVIENEDLRKLEESIKTNGILEPIIVREKNNGRYEIISGHRRKKASELIGLKTIPAIIRNMKDNEATIYMVDSNLHREIILPSEKAFAYKMKLEALTHQGKGTSRHSVEKLNTADYVGMENNESGRTVQRYIRLTNLIPQLLKLVDNSVLDEEPAIALRPAVELSFLPKEQQETVYDQILCFDATPSHAQAILMKKLNEEGKLDENTIYKIMSEAKPNQVESKFNIRRIQSVLPKNVTKENMEDFVIKAIEHYTKFLKNRERGR